MPFFLLFGLNKGTLQNKKRKGITQEPRGTTKETKVNARKNPGPNGADKKQNGQVVLDVPVCHLPTRLH